MWSSIVPQLRILALFPSVPFPHDTVMTCDDCDDIVVTPKYTAFWRCDGVAMAVLEAVHLRTVTAPAREAISRPALAAQPISWWRLCRTTWSSRNDVFSFRFVSFYVSYDAVWRLRLCESLPSRFVLVTKIC